MAKSEMTDPASDRGNPNSPEYTQLLQTAESLVPVLRERAEETENLRRLPPETERDLHETGIYRILQPKSIGGYELDFVALIDVGEALGRGDASVSWNACNLGSHHWMLAMFPEAAQDAVWVPDASSLVASSFVFPAGQATRTNGGYLISGRWPLSSGVDSCRWNMLGGIVQPDDDMTAPDYRVFLLSDSQYTIIDTWYSAGLKGTGSKDVEVDNIFVPEDMTLSVADTKGGDTPGSVRHPGALFKLPVFGLFPFILTGCALGNAQGALDDFVESTRQRISRYSKTRLADLQSIQIRIAEAGARISAARNIMRSICIESMANARSGIVPDLAAKTRYRRDAAFSVNLCTEAVDILFAASGAGGLYSKAALQRQFRDAHAINAHIAFNFDAAGASSGRMELGLPSDNPTL